MSIARNKNEDNDFFSLLVEETLNPENESTQTGQWSVFQGIYLENLHVFRFCFSGGVIMDFPSTIPPFDQLWPKDYSRKISFHEQGPIQEGPFDALAILMPGMTKAYIKWKKGLVPNIVELECLYT